MYNTASAATAVPQLPAQQGGGVSQRMNQVPTNVVPLQDADFTKTPPGFPISTPSRPCLFDSRIGTPQLSHLGVYAPSVSNDTLENNKEYESTV